MGAGKLFAIWFLLGILVYAVQLGYMVALTRLFKQAWVRVLFYLPLIIVLGAMLHASGWLTHLAVIFKWYILK